MCPKGQWWILLAEIDEGEGIGVFEKLKTDIMAATLIVGLLIVAVAGFLSSAAQRRIRRMTDILEEIERGNIKSRVPPSAKDEIGQIGIGINRMEQGGSGREALATLPQ